MDRIKEAEMSVLAATQFSSDDDNDDDDNESQASGQFAPSPLAAVRKNLSAAPITSSTAGAVETTKLSDAVSIPTLPTGRHLKLIILSTWGDPFYVGLAGLEVFAKSGFVIDLSTPPVSVVANPPSVNVLGGDGKDPRTADKVRRGEKQSDELRRCVRYYLHSCR